MKNLEKDIIEFSELEQHIDVPVKYYSSVMIGRLAFSIAAMITPEILLIDEIFAVGDAHFVSKATQRITQMLDVSKIFVLVSHNLAHITQHCNRAIVMHQGKILFDGNPDEAVDLYNKRFANH